MSGTPNGQWSRRLTVGSQDTIGAAAAAAMIGRETAMTSPVNMREDSRHNFHLNMANWQATGVINNLPPRMSDGTATNNSKYTPRFAPTIAQVQAMGLRKDGGDKSEQDMWTRMAEERDAGKAADLALRDVLGSLEAARCVESTSSTQTTLEDYC